MGIVYTAICPTCLFDSFTRQNNQATISTMSGVINNDPTVQCTCQRGHHIEVYPREGKYTFMFWHAVDAYARGQLYEAAASGYAALEEYMKTYIQASAWSLSYQTQNILDTYQALNRNKLLMGNSTRIIGAYAFVYLHNAGSPIDQKRFENMSSARNNIVHGTEIPGSKSVGDLLVSIYHHFMESTLLWTHKLTDESPRTPFIPYYKISLAQAILHQANPTLQGQEAINALSQSSQGFIFDSLFIDEGTELESYINTMKAQLTTIDQLVEISPTLDGYR